MSLNPPLVAAASGQPQLVPAPYLAEFIALGRPGVELQASGLPGGPYSRRGTLFLTNMRLVFVPGGVDPGSGVHAVELPLTFVSHVAFNQPIFTANNISGKCRLVDQPGAADFALRFKEGGIGTFFPLAAAYLQAARAAAREPAPEQPSPPPPGAAGPDFSSLQTALVDPADPTVLYLTQPVADSQRLPGAPAYVT